MQHRYPGAYILHIDVFMYENRGYLPPLCLQVVIENAIFHNYGTVESPIIIKISGDQTLRICNNKKQHKHKRKGNSIALKNLKEQFNLLDEQVVRIEDTNESYTIWLPIIKEKI
jgi:LytS/YehU family sensor histidine kinase